MYVILEIKGSQFKVGKDTEFDTNRLDAAVGKSIKIKDILLFSDGKSVEIGSPHVKGVEVVCDVVKHFRGKKVIAYKYKRRHNERRKKGHRQDLTRLKVNEIKQTK